MKHYTATIPLDLAEKLKEKGMPMQDAYTPILYDKPESVMSGCIIPTYAACFDWLIEKGKEVEIFYVPARGGYMYGIAPFPDYTEGGKSWHEAANAAIGKALTLI